MSSLTVLLGRWCLSCMAVIEEGTAPTVRAENLLVVMLYHQWFLQQGDSTCFSTIILTVP